MKRHPRTKRERAFRLKYWQETGFDFIDDTTQPFADRAHWNVDWYESHTKDVYNRISMEMLTLLAEESA